MISRYLLPQFKWGRIIYIFFCSLVVALVLQKKFLGVGWIDSWQVGSPYIITSTPRLSLPIFHLLFLILYIFNVVIPVPAGSSSLPICLSCKVWCCVLVVLANIFSRLCCCYVMDGRAVHSQVEIFLVRLWCWQGKRRWAKPLEFSSFGQS